MQALQSVRRLRPVHRLFSTAANEYDVIVSGHGQVGGAFALAISGSRIGSSLRVAVIDKAPPTLITNEQRIPDARMIAIAPSTSKFLKDIGVWDDICAISATPFHEMKIWDSRGLGQMSFSSQDLGVDHMGHIVEMNVISHALWNKLKQLSNVDLITGTEIKSVHSHNRGPRDANQSNSSYPDYLSVELSNGSSLSCRSLVAADGAQSRVRNLIGYPQYTYDYDRIAVAGTVKVDTPHSTAWQRFMQDGPIALLPAQEPFSSVVWSTTPSKAADFFKLSDQDKVNHLNHLLSSSADLASDRFSREDELADATERARLSSGLTHEQRYEGTLFMPQTGSNAIAPGILTRIARTVEMATAVLSQSTTPRPPSITSLPGKLVGFPLRLTHSIVYQKNRSVLIGDAAHTVHPLAGQGANMGFSDAQSLANITLKTLYAGGDIGAVNVLEEYEQERKLYNTAFQGGIDLVHRIFDTDLIPIKYGRNIGMGLLNRLPHAKQLIMASASLNLNQDSHPLLLDRQ
eukprot:TRINITY_DN1730_c0_g1_i1.p1 TRINITY_DN1730_c0_g1~~TRINITY_DN1730_c0_g1_i1.p1  ORF type:complete len:517 (+),score=111.17 TRINITY_DN1730_c0_g1_i1:51-1601(+)